MPTRNRIGETSNDLLIAVMQGLLGGKGGTEIHGNLIKDPKFSERSGEIGSIRRIERLVDDIRKRISGSPDQMRVLDTLFEYHRLQEYGIDWASGEFLAEMWPWVLLFEFDYAHVMGLPAPLPPTARVARWWSRLRLARPQASRREINEWSRKFARGELLSDYLGNSDELSALSAELAFAPWLSETPSLWSDETRAFHYKRAIESGLIPTPPTPDLLDQLAQRTSLTRKKGITKSDLRYDILVQDSGLDSDFWWHIEDRLAFIESDSSNVHQAEGERIANGIRMFIERYKEDVR